MYTKLQLLCDSLPDRHLCDIIIGGDFNIDFRKSSSDKTKFLKSFMKKNTFTQTIEDSTRPLFNNNIIDLIFTNTNKLDSSGILDLNLSDHLPTYINIKKNKVSFEKSTFRGRSYKKINEHDFVCLITNMNTHTFVKIM